MTPQSDKSMNDHTLRFLSEVAPFSKLPEKDLQKVAEELAVIHYPQGHTLSKQGKTTIEHVHIIISGSLELYYKTEGKEILSGTLKSGDIFGGISILMNSGLSVRTVQVKEKSSFFTLTKDDFLNICNRHNFFYQYFLDAFGERMIDESYASIIAAAQARHFLADVVPFSFLPDEELDNVAAHLTIIHYPKNTVIAIQGQSRVDKLYIMQKGAAERYYEEKNKKKLRGIMGEGDIYGGISMLLNDMIALRTLRATENCYFYTIPQKLFFRVCKTNDAFSEYFTDTFGKRMLDRSYAAIVAKNVSPGTEAPQFFNQPVSSIYSKNLVYCDEKTTIREAAALMSRYHCSSIFVRNDRGVFLGLATDNDFRNKVIAREYDIEKSISEIMSSPLKTISDQALVFEALMAMMQDNIKHLAVTDSSERVLGVVTNQDLLIAHGQSPFFLLRELFSAATLETIIATQQKLPQLIQNLINSGAKAKNVNRFITTVSDSVLNKLIHFALEELGPPPVKFVFMILGSEGRMEQTLKTDQDNAIVFEDVPEADEKKVQKYFLTFGDKVCTWLDQAGYAFCEGGIMASNSKWCRPLSTWKEYFSKWIHTAEPEDLLRSSIFFDFRGAYGQLEIIDDLRNYLFTSLVGWSGFFRHLTENALYFKPPIGFFRNFVVESKGEHRDAFDIKHAMMPIVDLARIYALHNNIEETNTLERLYQAYMKDILNWKEYNEIQQAYSFLMQLRFVRQVTAVIDEDAKPDNYINPKKLSSIEQTMLKEIFKKIENFQTKLSFDFTGLP